MIKVCLCCQRLDGLLVPSCTPKPGKIPDIKPERWNI